MSNVVKLHLPAGNVRILRTTRWPTGEVAVGSVPTSEPVDSIEQQTPQVTEPPAQSARDEVQERLEAEFKAGFDEGRRQTEKHLRANVEKSLAETKTLTTNLVKTLETALVQFQVSAGTNVVRLALAIAERIVKREVMLDNEFIIRQIHEAVKRVVGIERLKIRIHPLDEPIVREYRSSILTRTDAVRELAIEPDETIARGGCIIESESGNVDALLATQLERIEAALLGKEDEER